MKRSITKSTEQAKDYLKKHRRTDLKLGEIQLLSELFREEINKTNFYQGLYELICKTWLFGFGVGLRQGKKGV